MKRIIFALIGLLLPIGLITIPATPASADTPGCVSRWEYNSITRNYTAAQVTSRFDTAGYQIARRAKGYWEDYWVDNSYWTEGGSYDWDYYYENLVYVGEGNGEYDVNGNYVGYSEYIDNSYWDARWVVEADIVRSYKKCRGFDGGRSRVGVWFDNYTHPLPGYRVWKKRASKPYVLRTEMLDWWSIWGNVRSGPPAKS